MRILLLSKYGRLGASTRYRSLQFVPYLTGRGHEVEVSALLSDNYVSALYAGKTLPALEVARSYARRLLILFRSRRPDLIWIEYEAFPWLPSFMESVGMLRHVPTVVDFDDAIFHTYDLHVSAVVRSLLGTKIDRIMKQSRAVIAGNAYIAQRASRAGAKNIHTLPTSVDLRRYSVKPSRDKATCVIGWIGTPSTVGYLSLLERPLTALAKRVPIKLVVIGARPSLPADIPVEVRRWSESTEVDDLGQIDIGVMPLHDSPWERGKCGHKLITYMASGKPVVASPVGVNSEIVRNGANGFLASTDEEWERRLWELATKPDLRERLGQSGRDDVARAYDMSVIAPRLHDILVHAARRAD